MTFEQAYARELQALTHAVEAYGDTLEPGIVEITVMLRVMGLNTVGCCEGHVERWPSPWVQMTSQNEPEQRWEGEPLVTPLRADYRAWLEVNFQMYLRLLGLVREFDKSVVSEPYMEVKLEDRGVSVYLNVVDGMSQYDTTLTAEERESAVADGSLMRRLEARRARMLEFAGFLREWAMQEYGEAW